LCLELQLAFACSTVFNFHHALLFLHLKSISEQISIFISQNANLNYPKFTCQFMIDYNLRYKWCENSVWIVEYGQITDNTRQRNIKKQVLKQDSVFCLQIQFPRSHNIWNINSNHRHNGMLQRNCVTVIMYAFIVSPTYVK